MLRTDAAIARLSVLQTTLHGRKHETGRAMELADFMPYTAEEEEEATLEELAAAIGGKRGK